MGALRIGLRMFRDRKRAANLLDEELDYHVERLTDENVSAGMPRDEARRAALRSFGNPALVRDQARSAWRGEWLESLLRDLRLSFRALRRTPGFTSIAVMVMALGIGANVALFAVVRGVILKPLPFADPGRLLVLYEANAQGGEGAANNLVAGGVYAEWKRQNQSFSAMALFRGSRVGLSGSGGQLPEKLTSAQFSSDLLPTLGVEPALGRNFTAEDDSPSGNGTVLLSWQLWKRRFAGDPAVLNRTIYIDARPTTVIGVMPAWFNFPDASVQLWQPVYHVQREKDMASASDHMLRVVGRLKPEVSPAQAVADLSLISRRVHDANISDPLVLTAANGRPLLDHMVGDMKRPFYLLLAATGCVLLIACLNVANLLVARAAARRKDVAIRAALGGGWLRIMRERLIESLLLASLGGGLGVLCALGALRWFVNTRSDMKRVENIHFDAAVAAFTVGTVALCALIAGIISNLGTRHRTLPAALHQSSRTLSGGREKARLRRFLLSMQVSLTVVLLIGAALLLKSYERLRSAEMGCATGGVLTLHIGLPDARYPVGAARANFFDTLFARIRNLPGIGAAGFIDAVPGMGYWSDETFNVVEHPALPQGKAFSALDRTADADYFATMGIPMLRGRTFNPSLRLSDADEVVIDGSFAQTFFPGEDPIGKHIQTKTGKHVIVGVAGATRFAIGEEPRPMMYFPLEAGIMSVGTIVIRSDQGSLAQFAAPMQRIVSAMDPDLPLSDVQTMDELLGKATIGAEFSATLLGAFAVLSLLLAAAGLFGVISYLAAQRTNEIGIRIALGARREQVLSLMLWDGLWPAFAGLAAGLAGGNGGARLLEGMLYKTGALDPAVYLGVAITFVGVALAACALPAWRASRLDPVQAIRAE